MRNSLAAICIGIASLALCGPPSADASMVINGDFESQFVDPADIPGWEESGLNLFSGLGGGAIAHSGNVGVSFGDLSAPAEIYQDLVTVAGEEYQLRFWLQNELGGSPSSYEVAADLAVLTSVSNANSFPYTEFVFNFIAADNSTRLSFSFTHSPGFFDLDDVSVNRVTGQVIPEPTSLTAWTLTVLGLGFLRRRRV